MGTLVTIQLGCPNEPHTYTVALRPYAVDFEETYNAFGAGVHTSSGPRYVYPAQPAGRMNLDLNLDGTIDRGEAGALVSSLLTINCV